MDFFGITLHALYTIRVSLGWKLVYFLSHLHNIMKEYLSRVGIKDMGLSHPSNSSVRLSV